VTAQPPLYILDSFALLAFFQAEPGGLRVRELLRQADSGGVLLLMTAVNLGEVIYRTIRERGSDHAEEVLSIIAGYAIDFVDVDRDLALAGAEIKGVRKMAYADCIAAALAQRLDATVITGDPEFRQVDSFIRVEWLLTSH
jgi:ribonuclease VapC